MLKRTIQKVFNLLGFKVSRIKKKSDLRFVNVYRKYQNYTMIFSEWYIENLKLCEKFKNIEGDVVECGVWKGGMIAGIAEILGGNDRTFYLFDSFEGLPLVKPIDGEENIKWQRDPECDNLRADIDYARQAMRMTTVNNYQIVKGWFDQTLHANVNNKNIAILRLDADLYESTLVCLEHLYPQVVKNGLIIIDDYYFWEGASKAVHYYLNKIDSKSRIYSLDNAIAYIVKND